MILPTGDLARVLLDKSSGVSDRPATGLLRPEQTAIGLPQKGLMMGNDRGRSAGQNVMETIRNCYVYDFPFDLTCENTLKIFVMSMHLILTSAILS